MKKLILIIALLLFTSTAHAASITPKQVTTSITDIVNYTTAYRDVDVIGKDGDDTSIGDEFFTQRYGIVRWDSSPPDPDFCCQVYSGPSNYLMLSFSANGLDGLGNYASGIFTLEVDSQPFDIYIPSFTFNTSLDHISFYVADDGTTFYAKADHQPFGGSVVFLGNLSGSVDLAPSEAFSVEHLAASAGCSLNPKFNKTSSWGVGSTYYTDRAYTITGTGANLTCLDAIIKTPNNDRGNTQSSDYMTFEMPFDGIVYVAFDSRLTSLPNWASGYTKWTGRTFTTSLSSQPHMQLYWKSFSAGECVNLGGNKGPGSSGGTASNYVVFLDDGHCDTSCTLDPKFQDGGICYNGGYYYTDRNYFLTDVGSFDGFDIVRTPNNDRNNTMSSGYMKLSSVGGYYYVCYDRRASSPPNWLSSWTKLPCKIYTSLGSQGWMDVYKKSISAGTCVDLGGNKGPGFSGGTVSNYFVLHSNTNVTTCGVVGPCTLDPKFHETDWNDWDIGSTYYTDRSYTITSLFLWDCRPSMIKTPNSERNNTQSSDYMTFEMPFDGIVYVAFDSRLTSLPNWASDFTKWTGNTITTSLGSQPHMQVYWKLFSGGECVDLGGNRGPGSSGGTASNYIVFLDRANCGG